MTSDTPQTRTPQIVGLAENAHRAILNRALASVSVTRAGQALFHQVRRANSEVVARAYANIPADDLATTARVLTTITSRLDKELAGD